jgi:hypothetical protein
MDSSDVTAFIVAYHQQQQSQSPVSTASTSSAITPSAMPAVSAVSATPKLSFACPNCDRSFADADALKQHVTYKHSVRQIIAFAIAGYLCADRFSYV